jgi:hypothetical protein
VSVHLPTPLTRFVGRQAELAQAAALLAENRLLTLTGPGGAGKTRLALRVATKVAEDFPDGVWFVDLSSLSGGQFVWDQVAMALGVKEPGRAAPSPRRWAATWPTGGYWSCSTTASTWSSQPPRSQARCWPRHLT